MSSPALDSMQDQSWQFQPPFYNHPPTPLRKPASSSFSLFASSRSSPRASMRRAGSSASTLSEMDRNGGSVSEGDAAAAARARASASTPFLISASLSSSNHQTRSVRLPLLDTASDSDVDIPTGDKLAKESDVTVGGDAVPPEREYFGFALYVSSTFAFIIYILWAFLPQSVLHGLKIYYYPSRWWALAFPSFSVMLVVYIYIALVSYNVEILTPGLDELRTLTDEYAVISQDDAHLWKSTDGVWDLPIESVNYVLYSERHDSGVED
ncbi:PIG-P-domain-containing protein [Limtongia smithiae]|uniref:PIG-P-domain-containing protein n=1 Tax=Limtongia smithiae TaxID=1125753 RepID=UPI0034CE8A50